MKHLLIILSLLLSSILYGQSKEIGVFFSNQENRNWVRIPSESPDEVKYEGEIKNRKPNGHGKSTYPDGSTYEGEWKDGEYHGLGKYNYSNGNKYIGEFKDGVINGQGTFTWSNGEKYVGEWKNRKKHGQGTLTLSNGEKYAGNWVNGLWKGKSYNGEFTITENDTNTFKGIFNDGNILFKPHLIIGLIGIIIILFLVTKKNKSYKDIFINLSLTVFSTTVALLIIEYYLGIYWSINYSNYDKRTKFEYYLDEKLNDPNSYIFYNPVDELINKDFKLLPLAGISNYNTILDNENGYYAHYKSDRYGFNNDDIIWNNELIDTVIIGDSFVHGCCVNRNKNVAAYLSNFNNKSVLNLGISGMSSLTELAILKEYTTGKKINSIVWVFYAGNDFLELKGELNT